MANFPTIAELESQLTELNRRRDADSHMKADLLNDLAWLVSDIDMHRAYALGEQALAQSSAPNVTDLACYAVGRAYGLRTLGYINQRLGNHPLGLSQLLDALDICEAEAIADALPDVLDGIACIYFQIGDYPTALDYMHRQLAAAQRIDDKRRVANALNNLAALYWQTNDRSRAIETLHRNLQLADDIGYDRIRAIALINLAQTCYEAGEYEVAHNHLRQGLQLSQEAGFSLFELQAYLVAGMIHLQMGEGDAALVSLNHALVLSKAEDTKVMEAHVLIALGQACRDLHQYDLAVNVLQQGLSVATELEAKDAMSNVHQCLAEVYEKLDDPAQALVHIKQHQTLREIVAGEKAEQRLQVLQVAHDTATARQEAEIAHLRTVELSRLNEQLEQQVAVRTAELTDLVAQLQQEIAAREHAEAEIQQLIDTLEHRIATRTDELATFFDLTLLAGQAVHLDEVFDQALARIMEVTRSRALCIHLFDVKQTALYLAGQQNLDPDAQASLQTVTPEAAFQHWLQHDNDPLVTTDLAAMPLLPAAFRLVGFRTYLGAQIEIEGRTEGILSCYRYTDRGYGIDEIALVTALAQQLGIMLESQRLRQNAQAMAVLEERQRLARDLHDSVTQSLYSLSLFSRAGREAAEDGDTARLTYSLIELERNTLHALREMRLLLYELRPADLQHEGLVRAILLRLDTVERRVGLQMDVHLDELPPMPSDMEVELYHIIAEALNNVVKHAAANHLALHLTRANGQIYLHITDDGMGFDAAHTRGGLGLRNLHERVARLDGRLTIASAPGGGTQLYAIIPEPAPQAAELPQQS